MSDGSSENKKGVFFSIDALIALVILVAAVILIVPLSNYAEQDLFVQSDIIASLSSLNTLNHMWIVEVLLPQSFYEEFYLRYPSAP